VFQALSNEANELLPIFNKTTSKFYRTIVQTGDWSNQAASVNQRAITGCYKKHQLPQESMTGAM
jgi:pyruvate dehydrogenase kinase 2/3/4